MQFYLGVSDVAEELWKQELTVLRRVAALKHPALPGLERGGHIEESATRWFGVRGCAYVITRSGQQLYGSHHYVDIVNVIRCEGS
ncbi:hypothetical protein [Streptomyces sp. BK340]|uniref:hypothetical protein n=1 Tax=Streptomyces sp. BK340 TaxID=2572903 RepID=UPI0011A762F2|nr:hypothetical protein [Streptomyces sp. BK340]